MSSNVKQRSARGPVRFLLGLAQFTLVAGLATAPSAQEASDTAPEAGPRTEHGFAGTAAGAAPVVEIPWNRLYDYDEIYGHLDRLEAAFPLLLSHEVIGHSVESREMRVYTLTNPDTGAAGDKPGMWVDGNIHGNEVQGSEAVVYTAWYLLENYGHNERVTSLVDRSTFYLLPMLNPDGRASWFRDAHNAHSSRSGTQPLDSDRDGLEDEDGPDDLDGDGNIVQMRKYLPGEGNYRLDPDDPRLMERVRSNDSSGRSTFGDWVLLGSEGVDDDGDGRMNEDGPGGYDMNRAWPSMWEPGHVQYGAGPYPLYWPETRSVARFLYDHPNIAGVQSFHNAGGMILRGPGAEGFGSYPREDVSVYDALGEDGERMLPFYDYMVIWSDLYTVFGGLVTWTYEGLGIISFTNELWTDQRNGPDGRLPGGSEGRHFFDDALLMGDGFVDWHDYEHPTYGTVQIGGFKKDVGRVPPSFLIEEMVHRNALFAIRHAEAMPELTVASVETTDLGDGVTAVDVIFRNERLIPTRTARARQQGIGVPDVLTLDGPGVEVLAGGFRSDRFRPHRIELAEHHPERLVREAGVGSRDDLRVRWLVRGTGQVRIRYTAEKARDLELFVELP